MPNPTLAQMGFLDEDTQQEVVYDIEDSEARSDISALENKIGSANGIAELDGNGLVPASQLPSYVDDVLEGTAQNVTETAAGTFAATGFILKGELVPCTPEDGKTYVDTTSNIQYRWTGSGTNFVSMGSNLTLGETANTAYAGNKGKANADAIAAMKDGSSIDSFGDVETALSGKVDKVQGKGLSTNDYDNTAKAIVTTAQNNIKANTKLIKDTVGFSGKNLLKNVLSSQTLSNVTVTVDNDKTVNLNGTASENIVTLFINTHINLKAGKYYLSGNPAGITGTSYGLRIANADFSLNVFFEQGKVLEIEQDMTDLRVDIRVPSGMVCNNTLFKPMIRSADILDDTYEPYHSNVVNTLRDAEVIQGKNLLENKAINNTVRGITFTVNSDGTVVANGTQDGTGDGSEIFFNGSNSVFDRLKLSDFPSDIILSSGTPIPSNNEWYIGIWYFNSSNTFISGEPIAVGKTELKLTIPANAVYFTPFMRVSKNKTVSNIKIYPMLRLATETDPTYEPYYIPLKDSMFPRSEQAVLGAKNRFNPANYKGGKVPTITDEGKSINIASSDSAAWQGTYWHISVEKNTNYRLVGNAVVTSGGGLLNVKTTDNVTELATTGTFTTNKDIELTFNSGNNTELRVSMFCSLGTASAGDVSYNDISCILATDPDDTYAPYAMTNRELTDAVYKTTNTGSHYINMVVATIVPSNAKKPELFIPWHNPYKKSCTFGDNFKVFDRTGGSWNELAQSGKPDIINSICENGFYINLNLTNDLEANKPFTLKIQGDLIFG